MTEHTELPWRLSKYHYPHSEIVADRGTLDNDAFPHSRLICRISDNCKSPEEYKANAEYIVRACNAFQDIEEGISLIAEKSHYYQLEAQAKSQPALLAACKMCFTACYMNSADFLDTDQLAKLEAAIKEAGE